MTIQIAQCQSCGNFKHVSWFATDRICIDCDRAGLVYKPFEIKQQEKQLDEHLRRAVKAIIAEWCANDDFPEEITANERKVILRRTEDFASTDAIARELGISVKRAEAIEKRAQAKLLRLAREAAPLWLLSGGEMQA